MGWESRGGNRFFYRSLRRNGRVVRRYLGRGPHAELAARMLDDARFKRVEARNAVKADRLAFEPLERLMGELEEACRRLSEIALSASGYRRVNFAWRRIDERWSRKTATR